MERLASLILALGLIASAWAQAPPDEDAPPDGAIARLGSRRGRWRAPLAHVFVDNGRKLLCAFEGPELTWRDVPSGRLLRLRRLGRASSENANLSGDGRFLAIEFEHGIDVWDLDSGKRIQKLNDEDDFSGPFEFTRDGAELVLWHKKQLTGLNPRTGARRTITQLGNCDPFHVIDSSVVMNADKLYCLELKTGKEVWATTRVHDFSKLRALSGGWIWLPAAELGKPSQLLELATGKPAAAPVHPSISCFECAAPDGRRVCAVSVDFGYQILDLVTCKEASRPDGLVAPFAFSPGGRSLLGGDGDGYWQRWDIRWGPGPLPRRYPHPDAPAHTAQVSWLGFTLDGRSLISHAEFEHHVRVWDLGTRKFQQVLDHEFEGHEQFALTPDARLLHLNWESPTVYDLATGKPARRITLPNWAAEMGGPMWAAPDGRTLHMIANNSDMDKHKWGRWLMIWDTETGRLRHSREGSDWHGNRVLSPDGSLVATAAEGIRHAATGRLRLAWPGPPERSDPEAFSPDGALLAVRVVPEKDLGPIKADEFGIVLYEVATGKPAAILPTGCVRLARFAPNGKLLIVSGPDHYEVWDTSSHRELARWAMPPRWESEEEHFWSWRGQVVAISPDSKLLATGHSDGTILLWRLPVQTAPSKGP
jgi:WD40 repeat protein